jgi:hypothetical protein
MTVFHNLQSKVHSVAENEGELMQFASGTIIMWLLENNFKIKVIR